MSNLLPRPALKAMRLRVTMRFVSLAAALFVVCAAVTLLALAPAYAVLRTQQSALAYEVKTLDTTVEAFAGGTERTSLTNARQQIGVLDPLFSRPTTVTEATSLAIGKLTDGISVTKIYYKHGEKAGTLQLSGSADTRQQLAAFAAHLKNEPLFTKVDVPVSSLAGGSDGRFTITLTGDF